MSERDKADAYCRNCGYIADARVTHSETCDECHTPVEYHAAEDQDTIATLRSQLAEAKADNARLREALDGVRLTDRTPYYEHHEPRPDGMVPRDGKDRGTCWLTPREIAQRALADTEPSK